MESTYVRSRRRAASPMRVTHPALPDGHSRSAPGARFSRRRRKRRDRVESVANLWDVGKQILGPSPYMLHRIIASVLALSLIGYGATWAFADHALDVTAGADTGMHAHGQTAPDADGSKCDHCCHASAHMVGLAPPGLPPHRRPSKDFHLTPECSAASLATAPPVKPPRS